MKKKILIIFMCFLVLFSINTVYATEIEGNNSTTPTDGYYIEGEDGPDGEMIFVPNEDKTETQPEDNLQDYEMEDLPTEPSPDNNKNNNNGNNNNSDNEYLGTGDGSLFIEIDVGDNFHENILVLIVDKETQETIQIPVYASNKWICRSQIPAGKYFVLNAISSGDNPNEQEWIFSIGEEFAIKTDETTTIKLEVVISPEGTQPTIPPDETIPDNITDTELQPEDTMTDEEFAELNKEELTTWDHVKILFKGLFSLGNLFLLSILAGCCIAYLIYKKKQNED